MGMAGDRLGHALDRCGGMGVLLHGERLGPVRLPCALAIVCFMFVSASLAPQERKKQIRRASHRREGEVERRTV